MKIKSVVYYFLKISRNRPGVFIEGPENLSKSTPKTKKMAPSARSLKTCLFIPLNAFYTSGNPLLHPLKYQKISPAAGCTPRKINLCILVKYHFFVCDGLYTSENQLLYHLKNIFFVCGGLYTSGN